MNEDSGKARLLLAVLLLIIMVTIVALLVLQPPANEFVKAQLVGTLGFCTAKLGDTFTFYYGTSAGAKTLSAAQAETAKAVVQIATSPGTGNGLTSSAAPTGKPGDPVSVVDASDGTVDLDLTKAKK